MYKKQRRVDAFPNKIGNEKKKNLAYLEEKSKKYSDSRCVCDVCSQKEKKYFIICNGKNYVTRRMWFCVAEKLTSQNWWKKCEF